MAYLALYRKFRPLSFNELVGQENITKVLKHQIESSQVGHAYLFCGGRGTGKTSTAKIFSRAVNCLNPKDGDPCNECEVCKGIISGSLSDVLEIDAASNNSVDNIRSIRDDVIFAPTLAKYKIYIIDEVHMLSSGAFNALLKTLEEPPAHVIFILATTEPHKLPVTILSRCQRFEFKRISIPDISDRLASICTQSHVNFTPDALNIIATVSEGSLRDAISILDQVISSGVTEISQSVVKDIIGISSVETTFSVLDAILRNDLSTALKNLCAFFSSGKDIKYFVWELISLMSDALVYRVSKDASLVSNFSAIPQIQSLAEFNSDKLVTSINFLSELENKMKWAAFPNILIESGIISLCSNLNNAPAIPLPVNPPSQNKESKKTISDSSPISVQPSPPSGDSLPKWSEILHTLKDSGKIMLYGALVNTSANINGNTLTINFTQDGAFGKSVVEKPDNMRALKDLVLSSSGSAYNITCSIASSPEKTSALDLLENKLKSSNVSVKIE